ncbi:formylglycine-generating enzyme family protein [bacterium]|nr:formylglycine-generating enzyme family protein [bacterium]
MIRLACGLMLMGAIAMAAPVVSNVRFSSEDAATRKITYDLAGATGPVMVSVVLQDQVGKWIIPDLRALEGDFGTAVANGTGKTIYWHITKPLAEDGRILEAKVIVSEIGRTKTVKLPGGVELELARIPAGTFLMGGDGKDESPRHMVWIKKDFYLGKTEVSQKQWDAVLKKNTSNVKGNPQLPVESVSWDLCSEFIDALNKLGKDKFRMPSEAEWEYACRAGTTTRWFFGDDAKKLGDYAWITTNSGGTTHSVGEKKPNPFGLYDILGSTFEWVQDWYHPTYEGAPVDGSAWMVKDKEYPFKVSRGGAFHMGENISTPAYRTVQFPNEDGSWYGLRVACDAESEE